MRHSTILPLFLSVILTAAMAQERGEKPDRRLDPDRVFFGGNFGMRFGDNTFVNLSPQVGYRLSERLQAGVGINFVASAVTVRDQYRVRQMRDSYGFTGLNAFGRFFPVQRVFASVQPEYNYSWGRVRYFNGQPDVKSKGAFVPVLLVGLGTAIPTGRRGNLLTMVQYDVVRNARSPYGPNVFVTFGFNF